MNTVEYFIHPNITILCVFHIYPTLWLYIDSGQHTSLLSVYCYSNHGSLLLSNMLIVFTVPMPTDFDSSFFHSTPHLCYTFVPTKQLLVYCFMFVYLRGAFTPPMLTQQLGIFLHRTEQED